MDDSTTIINVKGVRRAAWNAATRAASLGKEPYGHWLSDAIDQRIYREARGANQDGQAGEALSADQLTARIAAVAELAKGIAALKAAGSRAVGLGALSRILGALISGQEAVKRGGVLLESGAVPTLAVPQPVLEQSMP